MRKETGASLQYAAWDSGRSVCFETHGEEFASVARLIQEAAAKAKAPQFARTRALGTKVPGVTGVRPETRRSSPWEGEVLRKRDGGSLAILRYKSFA